MSESMLNIMFFITEFLGLSFTSYSLFWGIYLVKKKMVINGVIEILINIILFTITILKYLRNPSFSNGMFSYILYNCENPTNIIMDIFYFLLIIFTISNKDEYKYQVSLENNRKSRCK